MRARTFAAGAACGINRENALQHNGRGIELDGHEQARRNLAVNEKCWRIDDALPGNCGSDKRVAIV